MGVTKTVQTSVLYQGSESRGVRITRPRKRVGIFVVSDRVRFERRNRSTPETGLFHQGGVIA